MENLLCKFNIINNKKNNFEIIDASHKIDKLCTAMYDCTQMQMYNVDISQTKNDIDQDFNQVM